MKSVIFLAYLWHGTVNSVNFCVFGNTFYHENRKKSQIVVFPWVLIKSVIVLYLVFRAFTAFEILCLLIFHTLTAANHRLSTAFSESNFFFRESRDRDYNWIIFFYTWFNFDRIPRRWPGTFVFKLGGGSCRVLILFKWLACVYPIRHTHRQFTCLDDLGLWTSNRYE